MASDAAAGDRYGAAVAVDGTTALIGARGDDGDTGAAYLVDAPSGDELAKLVAGDAASGDRFGTAVAIRGGRVLVGADRDDDHGLDSGAAYLFDAASGASLAKLLPDDGAAEDYFGFAVALDGTTAVVGAYGDDDNGSSSGAAYVFDAATGDQLLKLLPADGAAGDFFGYAVGVSGSIAVVGAWGDDENGDLSGSAYLFDTTTGRQLAKLLPADDADSEFGISVAVDGGRALVGAWYDDPFGFRSGSAYLFETAGGAQTAKLVPADGAMEDQFGYAVSIRDGTAMVGAHSDDDNGMSSGSAYLFDATTGAELAKLLPSDGAAGDLFGGAVATGGALAVAGAQLDVQAGIASGSAYLFCAPPVSYCTAGTSAAGCHALVSASGTASASAATGFVLTASGVEGDKDGLFFFGTGGRQANAWGNGTSLQCVVPPVKRASLLAGNGTVGACDGVLAEDLNARWTAKPAQNPGAGAVVGAQLWYRDPFNTSNQTTSLSDAIEFCVEP